jgi:hypothetical protein
MFERYIEISKALMNEGFETKTFHTTFIIRKKRLQKIGINDNKTHPASLKYKYSGKDGLDIRNFVGIHSELSAILKYGKEDCSDCVFINIRIDRNGNLAMSKPCKGCQDLLNQVGYQRVYYTNIAGEFEEWR